MGMKFNRVVTVLLLSDLLIVAGYGLLDPILAVFISGQIVGATLSTVGIASGIFLITKSVVQIPFSRLIDRHNDKFDVHWLFYGTALVATAPLIYLFASEVKFVYLAQLISGLGSGMAYPAWLGLWSTHLDRGKESFEWSFYSTITGVAAAITAPIGAYIVEATSFRVLFLVMFLFAATGSFSVFLTRHLMILKKRRR